MAEFHGDQTALVEGREGVIAFDADKIRCGQALGEAWPRANRSGTGRGGDVTGSRNLAASVANYWSLALAVDTAGLLSPSETQTLGSPCDWRLTKR